MRTSSAQPKPAGMGVAKNCIFTSPFPINNSPKPTLIIDFVLLTSTVKQSKSLPFKPLYDKIWGMNPNVEKISKVIKNLEHLEKCAKYYQEHWPTGEINHLGLNTGADNYWSQNAQPLVEEINLNFEEIWSCLAVHTKRGDNFGGYFPPVGTVTQNLAEDINYVINKSRNSDDIYKLIQHLKKIQQREVKSQQNQEQAKAEQENKAGKEPKPKKRGRRKNSNRDEKAKEIMDFRNDGGKPWKEVATEFGITSATAQQKVRRYKARQRTKRT